MDIATNLHRDLEALTHRGKRFDAWFTFLWLSVENQRIIESASEEKFIRQIRLLNDEESVRNQIAILKRRIDPEI